MLRTSLTPLAVARVAYRDRRGRRLHGALCLAAWLSLVTALSHLSLRAVGLPPIPVLGANAAALCVVVCTACWLVVDIASALVVLLLTLAWAAVPAVAWGRDVGVVGLVAPTLGLVAATLGRYWVSAFYQADALRPRAMPHHEALAALTALLWGAFSACRSELLALRGFRPRGERVDDRAWASLRRVERARWRNWAGTVTARPQVTYVPRSIADLAAAVAECAASNRRVRVVGGSFTWASFGATDDALILCAGLDRVEVDTRDPAHPAVWAECGATNRQINDALFARGLELPFNVVMETVRVGGITSVGTHGSGRETSTLGDLVEAYEVIDARGERRVLSEATVGAEAMSAARLSFGLFGVIARVRLRVKPAAPVRLHNEQLPVEQSVARLIERIESEESAELLWMPFARRAWVRSYGQTVGPLPPRRGLGLGDLAQMLFLTVFHHGVARAAPPLLPSLLRSLPTFLPSGESVMRRSEAIHYRRWLEVRRATCVEVGFKVDADYANVHAAFATARRVIDAWAARGRYPIDININIRFTGPSGALLSAAYGPGLTCFIEALSMARPRDWEACSAELMGEWLRIPGALPHWAKEFEHVPGAVDLLRERLGDRRRRFLDALRRCDVDPEGRFRNRLLSRLLFSDEAPP